MFFQFEIPDDKLKKVMRSGSVKMRIFIRASTVEQTQKNIVAEEFFKSVKNALPPYSIKEQKVINTWNNHPYIVSLIKDRKNESRNYPVYDRDCTKDFDIKLRRTIKTVGVNVVTKQISIYLDTCMQGRHIWSGINHGFKSLFGFLHKLYTITLNNEKPWWDNSFELKQELMKDVEDDDPKMTERIFQAYGKFFMDVDYNVARNSREYEQFVKLRKRIISKMKKREGKKPTRSNIMKVVNILFEACEGNYSTVFPGTLISKYTWEVVLPQYVKKI